MCRNGTSPLRISFLILGKGLNAIREKEKKRNETPSGCGEQWLDLLAYFWQGIWPQEGTLEGLSVGSWNTFLWHFALRGRLSASAVIESNRKMASGHYWQGIDVSSIT